MVHYYKVTDRSSTNPIAELHVKDIKLTEYIREEGEAVFYGHSKLM